MEQVITEGSMERPVGIEYFKLGVRDFYHWKG